MPRIYTDERRWANTDPSLHFNGSTPRSTWPRWRNVYDYCLKRYDYDAAELIMSRNIPLFGEVEEVA